MKKVAALFLAMVILMASAVCYAEVDLKSMTFDDLIALRDQLNAEILSRPEWKEVKVPAGEWVVGKDIPAGSYSIVIPKGGSVVIHLWGAAIGDYKTNGGMRISDYLKEGQDIGKIELYEGNVLELGSPIILAPPVSLGF